MRLVKGHELAGAGNLLEAERLGDVGVWGQGLGFISRDLGVGG